MDSTELHYRTLISNELTGLMLRWKTMIMQNQDPDHLDDCDGCSGFSYGLQSAALFVIGLSVADIVDDEVEHGIDAIEEFLARADFDPHGDVEGKPE